jgi:calpain-15
MSPDPNRIKKLFAIRQANREGIYCIALCVNGIWEEVVIDDFFPLFPYSKAPVFSSINSPEIIGEDE